MTAPADVASAGASPSPWIRRWSHLLPAGCPVLDVACGSGRHLQWFADRGHAVWGVDRNISGAQHLSHCATLVEADLEAGGWPFMEGSAYRKFGAVVVTNYLWRALLPAIGQSLEPGGVLLYETFARGNEALGRPSRAEFLLESGELLRSFPGLHIVAYENGVLGQPARCVQRLAGIYAPGTAGDPAHAPLHALSLE